VSLRIVNITTKNQTTKRPNHKNIFGVKLRIPYFLTPCPWQMYAINWKCETGLTGNGELILDYETLIMWLSQLRQKYPDMEHWGQDETGQRVM
jgi:hypothetical protein